MDTSLLAVILCVNKHTVEITENVLFLLKLEGLALSQVKADISAWLGTQQRDSPGPKGNGFGSPAASVEGQFEVISEAHW